MEFSRAAVESHGRSSHHGPSDTPQTPTAVRRSRARTALVTNDPLWFGGRAIDGLDARLLDVVGIRLLGVARIGGLASLLFLLATAGPLLLGLSPLLHFPATFGERVLVLGHESSF